MKTLKSIYAFAALTMASSALVGCSDDKEYDFPGDPYNRVYVTDQSASAKLILAPGLALSGLNAEITTKCNQIAKGDITVTFVVDNSLVEVYNAEHDTNYSAMPDNALAIENLTVTIPAGEMKSTENVIVKLTEDVDILSQLTDENGYLIPVRLENAVGGDAQLSTNVNLPSFFTVDLSSDLIDGDATEDNRAGKLVADRSGWSVIVPAGFDGSAFFDGDNQNTATIEGDSDGVEVVIDLGKEYRIDGITASYYYVYWGDYGFDEGCLPQGTQVYTSLDNQSWSDWGKTTAGSSWSAASFCGFIAPIPARYIKLIAPSSGWGDAEFQCGDFNVYAL